MSLTRWRKRLNTHEPVSPYSRLRAAFYGGLCSLFKLGICLFAFSRIFSEGRDFILRLINHVLNISSVSGKNPALSGRDAQGQIMHSAYTCLWAKLCDCTHGKPDKTRTEICTPPSNTPAARAPLAAVISLALAGAALAGTVSWKTSPTTTKPEKRADVWHGPEGSAL